MSALGDGWRWSTIGDLARVDSGPAFRSNEFGDGSSGVRLLRGDNIEPGGLRWRNAKTWPATLMPGHEHLLVDEGDLILAMDRPVVAAGLKLARVRTSDLPALLVQRVARIRPVGIESTFLYYLLCSPKFVRHVRGSEVGTQVPHITLKSIRDFPVPVPGSAEQRRIVSLIEDHLSRLDQATWSVDAAAARTRLLRTALIERAVRAVGGPLSPLADHVSEVKNGVFVSRASRVPDGVPILRIGSVRPLHLDLSDLRYSSRSQDDLARENALLRGGDLLFTRYNGNPRFVGACVVVPEGLGALTYPDKLIRVRVGDHVDPTFLAYACSVGKGRAQIQRAVKTTSGQAGISGKDLRAVEVPMPSLQAQRAAVRDVERGLDALPSLTEELTRVRRREVALRRRLLAAAFSGAFSRDDPAVEGPHV